MTRPLDSREEGKETKVHHQGEMENLAGDRDSVTTVIMDRISSVVH